MRRRSKSRNRKNPIYIEETNLSRFGFGRLAYSGHLGFVNVHISAVWRAIGLKFGIQAYYPQIYYWDLFFNYGGDLGFFQKALSQLFKELQSWNSEFKLITPKSITGTYFLIMAAILDFFKKQYLSCLKIYRVEIQNSSLLPPNLLLGLIF